MATEFPTKYCVDSHFTAHHRLNQVLYHNPLQLMMVVAQRRKAGPTPIKATTGEQLKVKAVVRVKCDSKEYVKDMMLGWLDSNAHTAHTGVVLQLVSAQLEPKDREKPKLSKETRIHWSRKTRRVQPHTFSAHKRVFFSYKLREKELKELRGEGGGDEIRRFGTRIYEYDVYKDLGNPDKGDEFVRPILGGQHHPYPRCCRSNRPPTSSDVKTESPTSKYMPKYVPRDEAFEDPKKAALRDGKWKAMLSSAFPMLKQASSNTQVINNFSQITSLYKQTPPFEILSRHDASWGNFLHHMIKQSIQHVFKFDPPKLISRDVPSCCLRDDELGRLTLAGMNPLSIERLKVSKMVNYSKKER